MASQGRACSVPCNCSQVGKVFCGKDQQQVKWLLGTDTAKICDQCIALCREILDEEAKSDDGEWQKTQK